MSWASLSLFLDRCLSRPERTSLPLVQLFQILPSSPRFEMKLSSISVLLLEISVCCFPLTLSFAFDGVIYCVVAVWVSAIPAERIPPDQTHQCGDFLLQGSTVQQARGVCGGPCLILLRKREFFLHFSLQQLRTRSSLLENLQAELSTRSRCMMGDPSMSTPASAESGRGTSEGSGGFIENFKVSLKPCTPAWFGFISFPALLNGRV